MKPSNPLTKALLLNTIFAVFFLAPTPTRSCEHNCRGAILTSIQELFNPRIAAAYQTFNQTLYMNLPLDVAQPLAPFLNNAVSAAQQAAVDPAHATDAQSIRGIFRPQVPLVGKNVLGFSGPNCCPANCTGDCCSDEQWPNVTTVFTKGEMICGSEYSTSTNMDTVFNYAQTILGARSEFATLHSAGSVAMVEQVSKQLGANNPWMSRFMGNLNTAIKNLQTAYSLLKSDLGHTYSPLSMYLICMDHNLDRPEFHPNAHTENCTKPVFPVSIPSNEIGYLFPPTNYDMAVDEGTKAIAPLFDGNYVAPSSNANLGDAAEAEWLEEITAELDELTATEEPSPSGGRSLKQRYARRLSEHEGGAQAELLGVQ